MTLTAHAVTGAALVATFSSEPAIGCGLAWASHYVLDSIPHWDVSLRCNALYQAHTKQSLRLSRDLIHDLTYICLDGSLGVVLALLLFTNSSPWWMVLLGASFGMLPDALQFMHARFPHEPLTSLNTFHAWAHSHIQIKKALPGVVLQAAFVFTFVTALQFSVFGVEGVLAAF